MRTSPMIYDSEVVGGRAREGRNRIFGFYPEMIKNKFKKTRFICRNFVD